MEQLRCQQGLLHNYNQHATLAHSVVTTTLPYPSQTHAQAHGQAMPATHRAQAVAQLYQHAPLAHSVVMATLSSNNLQT